MKWVDSGSAGDVSKKFFVSHFSGKYSPKTYTQNTHALVLASNSIFYNFFRCSLCFTVWILIYLVNRTINFCFAPDCGATVKQWLVTWLLNQNKAGSADEQSMYSLMSMGYFQDFDYFWIFIGGTENSPILPVKRVG